MLLLALIGCPSKAPGPRPEHGQPDQAATSQDVRNHVAAYFAAIRTGDSSSLAHMLAEDYQLVGMSGAVWTKAERLQELTANGSAFPSIALKDATVRLYGPTAIVIGLVEIQDGADLIQERFTQVWLRTDTTWQMVSGQITPIAASATPRPAR